MMPGPIIQTSKTGEYMARTKRKNPELSAEIGKVIRRQRKAADMTQAMFAEAIGLESETVSRMENGVRLPTIEKLVEMADLFRVPVAVFFENVGPLKKQQETQLMAEKISAALDKLPDAGKNFVLEVAQDYARYHLTKPKARKKD
jgi:transcriptional regulator with XRE-family HTH domain